MSHARANENPYAALAELGGRMPGSKKPKDDPLFGTRYKGNVLGQMRAQHKRLFPDHAKGQPATREQEGRALKRLGKERNNQSYIDQGRKLQYGHLSPEELLQRHPSAFLRQYTIKAGWLQHPEAPLGKDFDQVAKRRAKLKLVKGPAELGVPDPGDDRITEESTGIERKRKGHFNLIRAGSEREVKDRFGAGNLEIGPQFEGGFLPMVQSRYPKLTSAPSERNVEQFKKGKLGTQGMEGSPPVFTTELSGCSITHSGGRLVHIRPHAQATGEELQSSLPKGRTFGRGDYPASDAFVMLRKKGDRMKLYYQKHSAVDGRSTSGSRYLE